MTPVRIFLIGVVALFALTGCQALAFRATGVAGEAVEILESRLKETIEVRSMERATRRATVRDMVEALNAEARAAVEDGDIEGAVTLWHRSLQIQDEHATELLIQKWIARLRRDDAGATAPD
jgi:hypothetical protein